MDAVGRDCILRELGRSPFASVWPAMETWSDARGADSVDELWLVEHEPVFTLGQAGREEHVLAPGDIPVIRTNRGGQVTYHGPGQVVAYPLLDLRRLGLGVREYVACLEQAMIETLAFWNLRGERRAGAPGVYVDDAKVGALGIRVRRGCSFHGIAFNVDLELGPFARINPCGYQGLRCTSMLELGVTAGLPVVRAQLAGELCRQFGLRPQAATPAAATSAA